MAGTRDFLTIGGDGSTHEVINGLLHSTRQKGAEPTGSNPKENQSFRDLRFASLPLGTGNSFLRDVGIHDLKTAITAAKVGQTRACDMVQVTHASGTLYYANLLSLGFSARVGSLTNKRFKSFGASGYTLAVLTGVLEMRVHHTPYEVSPHLSGSISTGCENPFTLVSFSNSRYTGGTMLMAPEADVQDGKLDIIHVAPMGRLRLLKTFPKIFKGTHTEDARVSNTQAQLVQFQMSQPEDVLVDGEVLSLQLKQLQVLPQVLPVVGAPVVGAPQP